MQITRYPDIFYNFRLPFYCLKLTPNDVTCRNKWFHFKYETMVIFSGVDGSGKSTLAEIEANRHDLDRCNELDDLTMTCDYNEWPDECPVDDVVILTADLDVLIDRIKKREKPADLYETDRALYYFDCRYREIASYYGIPLIDTTHGKVMDNWWKAQRALKEPQYALKDMTPEFVEENFTLITEGESKKVFQDPLNDDYCYIVLKNTIYSHSMQSTGEIDGLAAIRAKNTRYFLNMLRKNMIRHAYVAINDLGVIYSKKMNNINQLEVIVKEYVEGTDKHSYYGLKEDFSSDGKYPNGPYVRFDWRNPNHLDENGVDVRESIPNYYELEREMGKEAFFEKYLSRPMGDKTISRHVIDNVVVTSAEKIEIEALKTFNTIKYYLGMAGIIIKDVCFMFSEESDRHIYCWSELNQDCMRVATLDESLDKDIWRTGGSGASEKLIKKWTVFNDMMSEITGKIEFDPEHDPYLFIYDYKHVINSYLKEQYVHMDLYLKIMRDKPRSFVVINDIDKPKYPDNLWTRYTKYDDNDIIENYPHIEVDNMDDLYHAIENSARRVLLTSIEFLDELEIVDDSMYSRLIVPVDTFEEASKVFSRHPDIAIYVVEQIVGYVELGLIALNFPTHKVFCEISHFQMADLMWGYGFTLAVKSSEAAYIAKRTIRSENVNFIFQNYDGTVVDTNMIKYEDIDFNHDDDRVQKIIIDRKYGNTVLLVGDFAPTKTFSNQSVIKSNITSLYESTIPTNDAAVRLSNSIWDPSENSEQLLTDFLSFLKFKGVKITDVLNKMNARRWNFTKTLDNNDNDKFFVAITSSKYSDKTDEYILKMLGIKMEDLPTPRSLARPYVVVDNELYGSTIGKMVGAKKLVFTPCKPKDIPFLLSSGIISGAITYNTVQGMDGTFKRQFSMPDGNLSLCLIKRKDEIVEVVDGTKLQVAAEHPELIKKIVKGTPNESQYKFVKVTGSSESFLVDKDLGFTLADAVVESGKTMEENGLEIYKTISNCLVIGFYSC